MSGRQWSIWMFVCECTGSPCKTLWWWAYYSERRMALFIYLFIFLSILTHAHVCAYMYACTYVCVCVYVYIYVRPWLALYLSVYYLRDVVVRGWKIFFVVFRWLVDWFVGGGSGRSTAWCVTYILCGCCLYLYVYVYTVPTYRHIYNIYRRTVYPISKIGCCWCCYYYCRCCCCACSCCWCLVILLYTPLYSPRHIHSSLALFFCLSPSLSSSLSLSGYFPHRFLYRVYGMHESSFRSLKENIFSLLTLVYFISRFYFVVKKRRCRHREQSSKVKFEQEASWEKKIE